MVHSFGAHDPTSHRVNRYDIDGIREVNPHNPENTLVAEYEENDGFYGLEDDDYNPDYRRNYNYYASETDLHYSKSHGISQQ